MEYNNINLMDYFTLYNKEIDYPECEFNKYKDIARNKITETYYGAVDDIVEEIYKKGNVFIRFKSITLMKKHVVKITEETTPGARSPQVLYWNPSTDYYIYYYTYNGDPYYISIKDL
jgi:ferric iron reductase protein FhuF